MSDYDHDDLTNETAKDTARETMDDTQEKWVYQGPTEKKKEGISFMQLLAGFLAGVFYLVVFAILPVFVFIAVDWVVYFVTQDTFFRDNWVAPAVMVLSTFLSGTYARVLMEESFKTMGVLVIGLFGLMGYAYITYLMLDDPGSMYSTWLPAIPTVDPNIVFGLPFVGLIGMFCYKFFSLRHFN